MTLSLTLGAPSRARRYLRNKLWPLRQLLDRCARAYAYATGTLTQAQAASILSDCQPIAGWYPLLELCPDDVHEAALETYAPHPDLRAYIDEGCQHVASRWTPHGDELANASDWAVEKAIEYAAQDGIAFAHASTEAEQ